MKKIDNELECRARKLIAYLDTELAIEESLPFTVGFLVEKIFGIRLAPASEAYSPAPSIERSIHSGNGVHNCYFNRVCVFPL